MTPSHKEGDFVFLETGNKAIIGSDAYDGIIQKISMELVGTILTLSIDGKETISLDTTSKAGASIEKEFMADTITSLTIYSEVSVRLREVFGRHVQLARVDQTQNLVQK